MRSAHLTRSKYRLFFTHSTENSINKPERKISTHCISLRATWHRHCSWLRLWSIKNMQYLLLYYNYKYKISWNCATEGSSFRAITVKQVYWKTASVFIYLDHSWYTVYCLFSNYIEFCLNPDSQEKATKNVNYLFNPDHHSRCITRNRTERWYVWRGKKKRCIVEMCLCCFIYHWLDKIKKP